MTEDVSFGGIVIFLLVCAGLFFFLRWVVRKMFAFREQIDDIEEPSNFWERLLFRFIKFIFRAAESISQWLERKSAFFAEPYDRSGCWPSIVFFVLWLLGAFFVYLGYKHPEQGIWSILPLFCFMPGIFEFLLPIKKEGKEKTLEYDLTWGGFVVYLVLFEILTLLIFIAIFVAIGWAIASNSDSTSSEVTREETPSSKVSETKTSRNASTSSSLKEKTTTSSSSSGTKSTSQTKSQVASTVSHARRGQVITVDCPKCGKPVAVNCRGVNGQSSDTGHCRNCGRLVYVLYENSSFGFRIIRVW